MVAEGSKRGEDIASQHLPLEWSNKTTHQVPSSVICFANTKTSNKNYQHTLLEDRCKISGEPSLCAAWDLSFPPGRHTMAFYSPREAPLHASFVFSILTRKLTYPTCRCSQRNIPTGSCYLWIESTRPRSRLAVASRAVAGTTRDDAAAYVSWAALRNGRCRCWQCSDYFGSDRVSLLRDHRKGPRVDQIPNDPCSMTGSTCFALTFLNTTKWHMRILRDCFSWLPLVMITSISGDRFLRC